MKIMIENYKKIAFLYFLFFFFLSQKKKKQSTLKKYFKQQTTRYPQSTIKVPQTNSENT